MKVTLAGTEYRGRAVTLPVDADARTVARAVRDGVASDGETSDGTVRVQSRRPYPVHERVGCIHAEMGVRVRTALAGAARARGLSTPLDSEIRACRDRIASLSVEEVSTADERQAVAAASTATERLREEVAEMRGELTARRADDRSEATAVAEQFRESARDLSEAETTAVAARQDLARRRREARAARDTLERRLELEDELANLRREARTHLVEVARDAYVSAVSAVPGASVPTDPFDVDAVTAALAVARVADFDAPVVLACDTFRTARAASAWLDAPVIYAPSG